MRLRFLVDPAQRTPLYQQVVEAIAERILGREDGGEEKLPSVRELALSLRINPNTVGRAYRELEASGLVVSRAGKGVYVSAKASGSEAAIPPELHEAFDQVLGAARRSGLPIRSIKNGFDRKVLAPLREE